MESHSELMYDRSVEGHFRIIGMFLFGLIQFEFASPDRADPSAHTS